MGMESLIPPRNLSSIPTFIVVGIIPSRLIGNWIASWNGNVERTRPRKEGWCLLNEGEESDLFLFYFYFIFFFAFPELGSRSFDPKKKKRRKENEGEGVSYIFIYIQMERNDVTVRIIYWTYFSPPLFPPFLLFFSFVGSIQYTVCNDFLIMIRIFAPFVVMGWSWSNLTRKMVLYTVEAGLGCRCLRRNVVRQVRYGTLRVSYRHCDIPTP